MDQERIFPSAVSSELSTARQSIASTLRGLALVVREQSDFRAEPGDRFQWANVGLADGMVIQSGQVVADRWGLVTLRQLTVTKGKNRLSVRRQ